MSLDRLRTFVEVYRQRSFTTAARNLGLTQPAISQQIAGLEQAIGRPLFERHGRGVVPTGAADELALDIGDRLDQAEAALAQARARSAHLAGSIQIVGHPDFLSEVVAPQLGSLLESGIRVRLHGGTRGEIERMLIHGEADLGVSGFPAADRCLRGERLRDEPCAPWPRPPLSRGCAPTWLRAETWALSSPACRCCPTAWIIR